MHVLKNLKFNGGIQVSIQVDQVLDAKGLACPMPIVKTRKAVGELEPGQVLEVLATDRGSIADLQAWAKSSGHQYIGTKEEGDVLKHYLRKATEKEEKGEIQYPHVIDNEELMTKVNESTILDVREPAEFEFGHIPSSVSIPFGELSERLIELNKADEIIVICRTGNRSDYACKQLADAGFTNVKNAVQGMVEWSGPIEQSE